MSDSSKIIKKVDLTQVNESNFKLRYVGCLVLTQDHKILLQQRGLNWNHFPGYLSEFGGRIEPNETPMHALVRELNEELGAKVIESEVINLGAITEEATKHSELIHTYFWHDKLGTITGCYEGEAEYFDNLKSIFDCSSKIMDSVRWLLNQCQHLQLLK